MVTLTKNDEPYKIYKNRPRKPAPGKLAATVRPIPSVPLGPQCPVCGSSDLAIYPDDPDDALAIECHCRSWDGRRNRKCANQFKATINWWEWRAAMHRYPRIVAHMIADSLGYYTPQSAAQALSDAINGRENWCEFLNACWGNNPVEQIKQAIKLRRRHTGHMDGYTRALGIVAREMEGNNDPGMLASWF